MINAKKWLSGENLRLRAPEPEDLELLYKMENDTTLWSVGNSTLPYSRYTLRNYIEQTANDLYAERQARFIIELRGGTAVGMIDIADYSPFDARAEVCIGLLGEYRGAGIAFEALKLLCDYAFGFLNLHQLYAYIPKNHEKSKKLFEKANFLETATLKEWKRDGEKFIDISLFQLVKKSNT
jgi:diamine N-acetyltransferase